MKKIILSIVLIILLIFTMGLTSTAALQLKEYLEGKFPSIFIIYLASLEDLDEYEKEFIDLLEKIPAAEQRVFAREVYENGFSLELLERLKLKKEPKRVVKPFLKVAYPGGGRQIIRGNPIFVFGCTTPSAEVKVTVNGVEVEKFDHRSGNFLTLVEVPQGIEFPIKVAANIDGEEVSLERTVIYDPFWKEMPATPLAIHPVSVQPRENQVLRKGDLLRVAVLGSPSAEALFRIGNNREEIRMEEIKPLSTSFSGKGIYQGSYLIKDSDIPSTGETAAQVITVTLRRGSEQISRELPGKVSFSSGTPSQMVEVSGERARFYRIIEDSPVLPGSTPGGGSWLTQTAGFDLLTETRFEVAGRAGEYVRVKLGTENYLIHQDDVQEVQIEGINPYSVLSEITLKETNRGPEIHLHNLKHTSFLIEDEPQQLKLILFGVKQSDNLIVRGQAASVQTIEIAPFLSEQLSDAITINIKLTHLLNGFNYYWDGVGLTISLRRLPSIIKNNPLQGRIIVVDPGHGGDSPGAIGPGDIHEKDVVLEISRYLQKLLAEKGARVFMTRSRDENINLQKRIETAIEQEADLFISIHANAHAEGADAVNYHGHMTIYNHNYNEKLAEIILDNLVNKTGLPRTRVWERPDLAVLRQTQIPGVMVETAFLMHPDDNWYLLQPEYQQELAMGIMNGINEYFFNLIPHS
jgi:N-acetylmuramoyl-L-alanine amidase